MKLNTQKRNISIYQYISCFYLSFESFCGNAIYIFVIKNLNGKTYLDHRVIYWFIVGFFYKHSTSKPSNHKAQWNDQSHDMTSVVVSFIWSTFKNLSSDTKKYMNIMILMLNFLYDYSRQQFDTKIDQQKRFPPLYIRIRFSL